jgi:hypothetical protein
MGRARVCNTDAKKFLAPARVAYQILKRKTLVGQPTSPWQARNIQRPLSTGFSSILHHPIGIDSHGLCSVEILFDITSDIM